jgi:hypothetical protein
MIDHDSLQEISFVSLIFRIIIAVVMICNPLRNNFPNQIMNSAIVMKMNLHNAKDAIFLQEILRICLLLLKLE